MPSTSRFSTTDRALLLARQALYRFSALALLDPRAGSWEELAVAARGDLLDVAADIVRNEPAAQADPLARGERPLDDLDPRRVLDSLPVSRAASNAAYERVFGLLSSCACPPCEAEYINGKHTFQRSQTMGDVGGFYQAFGLQTSRRHPERQDHIVLELEFMAYLVGRERQAIESTTAESVEQAEICRRAQQRFLQEHLAWWAPAFARLLGHEDRGGFFETASVFLAALIAAERAILDVPPPSRDVAPSSIERPDECAGCQLGA